MRGLIEVSRIGYLIIYVELSEHLLERKNSVCRQLFHHTPLHFIAKSILKLKRKLSRFPVLNKFIQRGLQILRSEQTGNINGNYFPGPVKEQAQGHHGIPARSEERRVGKE